MFSAQFLTSMWVIAIVLHLILLACAYLIFLERKVSAWTQDRVGPNRYGFGALIVYGVNLVVGIICLPLLIFGIRVDPNRLWGNFGERFIKQRHLGLGIALYDGLKLFMKEDYTPPHVDKGLFILAPILAVVPAMIAWAVIPWGGTWITPELTLPLLGTIESARVEVSVLPISVGVIYILAMGSLAVYGVALAGYASNNKYSFLGGLRATAQMLSYEIPLGLCVLIMILTYGSADAGFMTSLQTAGGLGTWGIVMHPLLAVIFFIAILAETNRAPFDLAEAEQELVGGFHTEYASMKWALFFLGEYMHMLTGCAFFCVLFLGGWGLNPINGLIPYELPTVAEGWAGFGLIWLKLGVFAVKVTLLLFVMMWVRWTLPRLRFDQLMKLAWRGLIPLVLVMMLVTGLLVWAEAPVWSYTIANVVLCLGAAWVGPKLPKGPDVNRRVRLPGSRFYPPLAEQEPAGA
jgi:NADH-quinone oxidoreductase subunit H